MHVLRFDDYEEIYRGRKRQIKKKKQTSLEIRRKHEANIIPEK